MNHGWEYRKLCDVTPAKSFDGEIEPCENKYWCLNLDKIESDTGRIIEYDYLESKDLHGSILKFSKNNVLFSKLRPNLNKVVVPMKDGFCTTELVPLCPIKDLNRYFLSYYLRNPRFVKLLVDMTGGAKMPRVKMNLFWDCEIPLPKLEIQNQIVLELDKLNELVELKRKQLKDLDALAQSLFYETFGDPIENPKGWEIFHLRDLVKEKLSYGSGASGIPYDKKIRYIRITDIDERGNLKPEIASSPSEYNSKYMLKHGDILLARSGATVGKAFLYKKSIGPAIYAGYLIKVSIDTSILNSIYLYEFTKTAYYWNYIRKSIRGAAQPNVNAQLYGNLLIAVPPLSLQNEFAKKIEAIEEQKRLIESSIADLETLLASRMDYWFND